MKEGESVRVHAPRGLRLSGKRLWKDIAGKYELRPDEQSVLGMACKTVDLIDELEAALKDQPAMVPGSRGQLIAHPLLAEVRMQRVAFSALLRSLKLPDQHVGDRNQQRDAATTRWAQAYGKETQ